MMNLMFILLIVPDKERLSLNIFSESVSGTMGKGDFIHEARLDYA